MAPSAYRLGARCFGGCGSYSSENIWERSCHHANLSSRRESTRCLHIQCCTNSSKPDVASARCNVVVRGTSETCSLIASKSVVKSDRGIMIPGISISTEPIWWRVLAMLMLVEFGLNVNIIIAKTCGDGKERGDESSSYRRSCSTSYHSAWSFRSQLANSATLSKASNIPRKGVPRAVLHQY